MENEGLELKNEQENLPLHPTHNLIELEKRQRSIQILSEGMATLFDLYANLKTAHWNIKGALFISLHKLFDELAESVLDLVDTFAERITALGGTADGRLSSAENLSRLPRFNLSPFDGYNYLSQLSQQFASLSHELQEDSKDLESIDPTTANFYLEVAMQLDKHLYFLESHLQLN